MDKKVKTIRIFFVIYIFSVLKSFALFPFVLPWNDATDTIIDLSYIIYRDINTEGFVRVSQDGHFAVNSGRIKFWGTNTTFGANFPSKSNAQNVAARLAKYGFNIVRLHHMDMYDIWTTVNPDRVLHPGKLDLLDYYIYQLKQKGIYVDINLLVSRPFNRGTDLPADIEQITDWKVRDALGFFDPQTRQLQKDYARDLLTHTNPYTGNAYINEPAVAFIEINNENGLTQAYLSSQLDNLPPYYYNLLNTQWNNWLKNKYATHSALEAAWGVLNQPLGSEMLTNGRFQTGFLNPWNVEFHSPATGNATVETGTGPHNYNCAKITVTTPGTEGWNIQFNHPNLVLNTGTPYTLTFYAKASEPKTINVAVMMAHSPWSNLGFSTYINLTTNWQAFTFVFAPSQSDTNARINFGNMGLATGVSFYFTDVSLKPGGLLGLKPEENLYGGGIDNFKNSSDIYRSRESKKDWFRFLQQTETDYWIDMKNYIKNILGAKQIVFGTIIGCSTPNVQSNLDAIDTHAYWQHPEFPGQPWSSTDWYVKNNPMVNNQQGSTVAGLGMKSVLNKPHCVTEYNHPHPYTYEAESMFFLSTYASLQDWDAVFEYSYNGSDNWNTQKIDGFFDVNQNTVKMASMIPAALAFYRGDILPAQQTVVIPLNYETEIEELLDTWAWWLVDGTKLGENPKTSLIHKVKLAVEGQSIPPGTLSPGSTDTSGNIMISDTGQIVWDLSNSQAGYIKVDTPKSKFVYGFQNGRTYYLSGVTITPGNTITNGFSSIAITAMDGNSIQEAVRILITALGTQKNTNAQFYQYPNTLISFPPTMGINLTLRNQWGTSPVEVEGIPATIILPCAFSDTYVWALDNKGAKKSSVPIINNSGYASFSIDPSYETLWYEVNVNHPEYTPTNTKTNTPILTPTHTYTPVVGSIVDDCENLGTTQNLWGGWWYTYNDISSTATGSKQAPGGPVTQMGKYKLTGNLVSGGWAGAGTNLSGTGQEIDLTPFEGISLYLKGDGTQVSIAIVTGNFSDVPQYNHWQYTVTTSNEWTFYQIPFSYFTIPWGSPLPFDLTRSEDIQFKIADTGVFDIEIDDVMFYYSLSSTPTFSLTHTNTMTFTSTHTYTFTSTETRTFTITYTPTETVTGSQPPTWTNTDTPTHTTTYTSTNTFTNSSTFTLTNTNTNTPTNTITKTSTHSATNTITYTPTNTNTFTYTSTFSQQITNTPTHTKTSEDDELKFDNTVKIINYPNPANTNADIKIRYKVKGSEQQVIIRIYTNAFRLIKEINYKKSEISIDFNGIREIRIKKQNIKDMATGSYYYIIIAKDKNGSEVISKISNLVILK